MRAREIIKIIEDNIDYIKVNRTNTANGSGKYQISNLDSLTSAIGNIKELGFIEPAFSKLANEYSSIYTDKSNSVFVELNTLNGFKGVVMDVYLMSHAVLEALKSTIPKQDELSLSIKLPEYKDLSNVASFVKDLDYVLKQALREDFKSKVTFQNFEAGSSWIDLVLENKEALLFFGTVVKSAYDFLHKQYFQYKQAEIAINAATIGDEARNEVLKALQDNVKTQAHLNAKFVMDEFNLSPDNHEYHNDLTSSITKMADLLIQGAEVHTALNAPPETKEAFPTPQTLVLPENPVKLLTDTNKEVEASTEE